jgi:hypothetical protein
VGYATIRRHLNANPAERGRQLSAHFHGSQRHFITSEPKIDLTTDETGASPPVAPQNEFIKAQKLNGEK